MGTWLRDRQFSVLCVAATMVGTRAVGPVLGVKCKAPLKPKIRSKERHIKWITYTFIVGECCSKKKDLSMYQIRFEFHPWQGITLGHSLMLKWNRKI